MQLCKCRKHPYLAKWVPVTGHWMFFYSKNLCKGPLWNFRQVNSVEVFTCCTHCHENVTAVSGVASYSWMLSFWMCLQHIGVNLRYDLVLIRPSKPWKYFLRIWSSSFHLFWKGWKLSAWEICKHHVFFCQFSWWPGGKIDPSDNPKKIQLTSIQIRLTRLPWFYCY